MASPLHCRPPAAPRSNASHNPCLAITTMTSTTATSAATHAQAFQIVNKYTPPIFSLSVATAAISWNTHVRT